MESRRWRFIVTVAALSTWWGVADADPQINLLNKGCSQYNASSIPDFFNNLNATFADLRTQLSSAGGSVRFATAEIARSSDPVYAMAQCRNYLSEADCLACYDAAVAQIRNCSAANGARVIYDGCFLRYFVIPLAKFTYRNFHTYIILFPFKRIYCIHTYTHISSIKTSYKLFQRVITINIIY